MKPFLISGMPRCRTAWLTAVLNAHGILTYHDVILHRRDVKSDEYGVCDPTLALMFPRQTLAHYAGSPIIRLYADDLNERFDALDAWSHKPLTMKMRRIYRTNYAWFAYNTPDVGIHVNELEDDDVVGEIITTCTRGEVTPSREIISIFQLLKIEEHVKKALKLKKLNEAK